VPPAPPQKITIPAGTQLSVRLNDQLDSERNQVGDTFHGSLSTPIVINGETVVPSGADVVGRVADVKSAGRFAGNSVLTLELTSLSVNGKTITSRPTSGHGPARVKARAPQPKLAWEPWRAQFWRPYRRWQRRRDRRGQRSWCGDRSSGSQEGSADKAWPEAVVNFQTINTLTVTPKSTNDHNAGRTPLS